MKDSDASFGSPTKDSVTTFQINETSLKQGFRKLKNAITHRLKPDSKYFYVTIWTMLCKPCIDEISYIDTLPTKVNKSVNYIMVSAHSDKAVTNFLDNKGIAINNFFVANGMIDFISGIFNELKLKNQSFPLHVIIDQKGNMLAYLFGAVHDDYSAAPVINFLNDL